MSSRRPARATLRRPAVRCIVALQGAVVAVLLGRPERVAAGSGPSTETILFIRHAEKSPGGIGQLSCRGLNRALALPAVLAERYKHVDVVFAPDPARQKPDGALSYDYVRPLATVEPTAVRFGLPVHAAIGFEETDKLRAALLVPAFHDKTILVAWEHHAMNAFVPAMLAALGGDAAQVPKWTSDDYDTIWRLTIHWTGDAGKASFAAERENLDDQSDLCPNAAAPPMDQKSPQNAL